MSFAREKYYGFVENVKLGRIAFRKLYRFWTSLFVIFYSKVLYVIMI